MPGKKNADNKTSTPVEAAGQAELTKIRSDLDLLDAELLRLLNMRAELSLRVGAIKKADKAPVRRPEREQQVLQGLHAQNTGPLSDGQIDAIYGRIFEISRELQQ